MLSKKCLINFFLTHLHTSSNGYKSNNTIRYLWEINLSKMIPIIKSLCPCWNADSIYCTYILSKSNHLSLQCFVYDYTFFPSSQNSSVFALECLMEILGNSDGKHTPYCPVSFLRPHFRKPEIFFIPSHWHVLCLFSTQLRLSRIPTL